MLGSVRFVLNGNRTDALLRSNHGLNRGKTHGKVTAVKVPSYSEIKAQEAKQRRAVVKLRGTRSAMARQRQVSLVGDGAKWRITNLPRVAAAMAKWI